MNVLRVTAIACLFVLAGCSSQAGAPDSCGLDSSVSCPSGTTGWSCTGAAQPQTLNADLVCSTDGTGDFCCAQGSCGYDPSVPCSQGAGYGCSPGASPPDATDPSLLCSVPTPTSTEDLYCCYTAPPTTSATCAQDPTVTGCPPYSYGFSCTGSDRPDADYTGLTCSDSGTPGTDAAGDPATLFCCTSS